MHLREQLFEHNEQRRLFGRYVQQSHAGLLVYEQLLEAHRERIHWLVEIGTGTGSLSLYWALWARLRGVPFLTVDNGAAAHAWHPSPIVYELLALLGAQVKVANCFSGVSYALISSQIRGTPGLLFCDGGDKELELRVFAPLAASASLIVVHDWPIEIDATIIESVSEVHYYEPWHSQSLELGTKAAILCRND